MRRIFLYIGLLISMMAWSQSQAYSNKKAYWEHFRKNLPNPYQTIGFVSFDDKSQLYIISEPPADVTLEQIEAVFCGYLYDIETKKWNYGNDGWVKDVVVVVEFAPDNSEQALIPLLNDLLYGYSDPALYQPLPFARPRQLFLEDTLDVQINASSLYGWFIEDNMPMEDFEGNPITFTDMIYQSKNAVYRSATPGFIAWILPKNGTIKAKDPNLRKFTLNSDMIIGSIASSSTVCIIGRERETDFYDVPPLRSEEVAMLAWAPKELAQSLDLNGFANGKMENNYDWCPAYLSNELNNTEIGHLLTITDIFMKDWLRGGHYEYNQYVYPKPNERFELARDSAKVIRFNWNTDGLYIKTEFDSFTVLSIRNTGSLNCSLFDSSELEETRLMDKEANAFFASLNNVDLFRVAQYFALYQIFKEYNITCPSYKPQRSIDKRYLMADDIREALRNIRSLTESEKDKLIKEIAEDQFYNLEASGFEYAFKQFKKEEREKWDRQFEATATRNAANKKMSLKEYMNTKECIDAKEKYDQAFEEYIQDIHAKGLQKAIQSSIDFVAEEINPTWKTARSIPEADIDAFCQFSSCPHDTTIPCKQFVNCQKYQHDFFDHQGLIWYAKQLGVDKEKIKNHYMHQVLNDTTRWHKTPKIVLMNNQYYPVMGRDSIYHLALALGGHSIKQDVQVQARKTERRQEKRAVSHYYYEYAEEGYSPTTTLSEVAAASKKAERMARNGDHTGSAVQALEARWMMVKPLRPEKVDPNSPLYQVIVREDKKARRALEEQRFKEKKAQIIKEQEERVVNVLKQRQEATEQLDQILDVFSQDQALYDANRRLVNNLLRQRNQVATLQVPSQEELEQQFYRPTPQKNPNQAAQEETIQEEYIDYDAIIKDLERQVKAAQETASSLKAELEQLQNQ